MNALYTFEPVRDGKVDQAWIAPIVADSERTAIERFTALWRELGGQYDLASLKDNAGNVIWTSAQVPPRV